MDQVCLLLGFSRKTFSISATSSPEYVPGRVSRQGKPFSIHLVSSVIKKGSQFILETILTQSQITSIKMPWLKPYCYYMAKLSTYECFIYQKLRPFTLQVFFCHFRVNATFSAFVIDFLKVIINPQNHFYSQNTEMCFHLSYSAICLQYLMPGYNQLEEKQNSGVIKAIDVPAYLIR